MEKKTYVLFGIIVSLGLIVSSTIIAWGLGKLKSNERFVTVRGLAEKSVKSDLVIWQFKFKTTGDDLVATQAELDKQKDLVVNFLTQAGFKADEIQPQGIRVVDKLANEYGSDLNANKRYVLLTSVLLRSENVDLVSKTQQNISKLISSGVALSDENYCGNVPNYLFTKLNDIKIGMLEEATKNAREAGTQFANDASADLGSIRRANQGYFSISALDTVHEGGGGGTGCGDADSIMKKVRVVSTIDFYLN